MNYENLKKIYETMPKGIKYLFSPFLQRALIYNPVYKNTYKELDEYEGLSKKEQNKITFDKLKDTLIYAYKNVPYYKKVFDEVGFDPIKFIDIDEFKKIPLLDKNIAVKEGTSLYSDENIPYYKSNTSGSTGKVFTVLLDKDSIYKERAFVIHYLNKFGFDPLKTRTLALWGHNQDSDYYYSPLKNEIVISPFRLFKEEEFENVWKDISAFRPEVISGYPSALYIFAQLMRKNKKSLPIKFVEFYAENYTDEIKDYIEKTFNCITTARYGHTERSVFAELYGEKYRFNDLYGYTEFVPIGKNEYGKEMYRIVCTGFLSRKMPLIRYATDDVITYDDEGNIEIHGHTTSEARVIGKNGARIYKGTLSPHIAPFAKVKLYQFVQYEKGKVYLDLILDKPFTPEEISTINSYYKRKCEGLLDVEIRIVDELTLNKRGKYSWLVTYIGENKNEAKSINNC